MGSLHWEDDEDYGNYDNDNDYDDYDYDDQFHNDMDALKRACQLTGEDTAEHHQELIKEGLAPDDNEENEVDNEADDGKFLQEIQKRLTTGNSQFEITVQARKMMEERELEDDTEETDADILQAIQNRFSTPGIRLMEEQASTSYETHLQERKQKHEQLNACRALSSISQEEFNLNNSDSFVALSKQHPRDSNATLHSISTCDAYAADGPAGGIGLAYASKAPKHDNIPQYARVLINALIKNRSCQRTLRNKIAHIEAKIDENLELRNRVKCLVDFQSGCKRKLRRLFLQDNDSAVKLISCARPRSNKLKEVAENRFVSRYCGPPDNKDVSKYNLVKKTFPDSLERKPWSVKERENLLNGLKQQVQGAVVSQVMENMSEENIDDINHLDEHLLAFSREVKPEDIRSFLPRVDWERLSSTYVPNHSGADCRARWLNVEDPLINHTAWSKGEEKRLLMILQQNGLHDWVQISNKLGTNRTPSQCLSRYQRSLNASIMKKEWTEEEDEQLKVVVETFGENDWQIIAANMEGRTGAQCAERWCKAIHPDRKKVGRWTVEEDKRLKLAVLVYGPKTWKKIAGAVPGRTEVQCRERWCNVIDPSLKLDRWTEDEDNKLREAVRIHGFSWSKVALSVPPRTDNQCWRRWKALHPKEVAAVQKDGKIRKAALISNFVGRKKERPEIGPSDFLVEQEAELPIEGNGPSEDTSRKCYEKGAKHSRDDINPALEVNGARADANSEPCKKRAKTTRINEKTLRTRKRKEVDRNEETELSKNSSMNPCALDAPLNEQNKGLSSENTGRKKRPCRKSKRQNHKDVVSSENFINIDSDNRGATHDSGSVEKAELSVTMLSSKKTISRARKSCKHASKTTQENANSEITQPRTPSISDEQVLTPNSQLDYNSTRFGEKAGVLNFTCNVTQKKDIKKPSSVIPNRINAEVAAPMTPPINNGDHMYMLTDNFYNSAGIEYQIFEKQHSRDAFHPNSPEENVIPKLTLNKVPSCLKEHTIDAKLAQFEPSMSPNVDSDVCSEAGKMRWMGNNIGCLVSTTMSNCNTTCEENASVPTEDKCPQGQVLGPQRKRRLKALARQMHSEGSQSQNVQTLQALSQDGSVKQKNVENRQPKRTRRATRSDINYKDLLDGKYGEFSAYSR